MQTPYTVSSLKGPPIKPQKIWITGIAGMIGFHLAKQLKAAGHEVWGVDNFNDYYEVSLKHDRAKLLRAEGVRVYEADIKNTATYISQWSSDGSLPDVVVHLAAYANPRHSLENPQMYIDTNITGTQKLIDACETYGVQKVIYASSSCVMHGQELPWRESDRPGHQNNPYGWSKRTNECQFEHSKIPTTVGLRFFTVYGPYGRPDMALFLFTKGIIEQKPIKLYNNGNMIRDFTYVDDIIEGIHVLINRMFETIRDWDWEGKVYERPYWKNTHDIYNIGYGQQVNLMDFVRHISDEVGKPAVVEFAPAHPADVPATWADTTKLRSLGWSPKTPIAHGVKKFVSWYTDYYGVKK